MLKISITSNTFEKTIPKHTLKGESLLKKHLHTLLRFLTRGLVFYGHYSGSVYWDYSNDWYDLFYRLT